MPAALNVAPDKAILVSDFDGTMTRHDFYQLVTERLIPPGTPNYWAEYRAGKITHFDALRLIFASAKAGEEAWIELTHDMGLDPDLAAELTVLRGAGWEVVVVSAGCVWYITRLFREAEVALEVFANPGYIEDGRLVMEWPKDSPFSSPETGIDKAAVVRAAMEGGRSVAFAGDGPPDLNPALLVPPDRRFARRGKDLAEALRRRNEGFRAYDRWADVAGALMRAGAAS